MKRNRRASTDFYDHPSDLEYLRTQTWMIAGTQFVGVSLIAFGLGILRKATWPSGRLAVTTLGAGMALLFLCGWALYCWRDRALGRFRHYKKKSGFIQEIPAARRKTRLLRGTLALIVLDTCLLAWLIAITGGLGNSTLDPLLPAIPIIAIILRQPHRTIIWSLVLACVVVVMFTLLLKYPLVSFWGYDPLWIYDSHNDPNYHYGVSLVALVVIVLSLVEYYFSYETPEIITSIHEAMEPLIEAEDSDLKGLEKQITAGAKTWVRWLSHRDLPLADLSLVHAETDVVRQAVVLSVPYWLDRVSPPSSTWVFIWWPREKVFSILKWIGIDERFDLWLHRQRRKRIARHVTFLTFAAHWIDDHFDALEEHCPDLARREKLLDSSPDHILSSYVLARLSEAVHRMERMAHKSNRSEVRKAVKRIIYGGLVQNASSSARLQRLIDDYVNFVTQDLFDDLKEVYLFLSNSQRRLITLLSAKVVMELLNSCRKRDKSVSFAKRSEFFNLLYSPILYYHDRESELQQEKYGNAFGNTLAEIEAKLPNEEDMVALIRRCQPLIPTIFGATGLSSGRKMQLQLLIQLYDDKLPPAVREAYQQILGLDAPHRQKQATATV